MRCNWFGRSTGLKLNRVCNEIRTERRIVNTNVSQQRLRAAIVHGRAFRTLLQHKRVVVGPGHVVDNDTIYFHRVLDAIL